MKAKDVVVGGLYTAKVNGRVVPVQVDAIRTVSGFKRDSTRWDVTNTKTGRKTTFRSAAKFRAPVNAAAVEADSKAKGRKALAKVFTPETVVAASEPVNTVSREHYGVSDSDYYNAVYSYLVPADLPEKPAQTIRAESCHVIRKAAGDWQLSYLIPAGAKDTDQVEILRHRKNQPAGSINMTRAEARAHYASQLRAGFVKV